jgi:hypothetical protein
MRRPGCSHSRFVATTPVATRTARTVWANRAEDRADAWAHLSSQPGGGDRDHPAAPTAATTR